MDGVLHSTWALTHNEIFILIYESDYFFVMKRSKRRLVREWADFKIFWRKNNLTACFWNYLIFLALGYLRVKDSSTLGLMEDLDRITFSDGHSNEFSMTILSQKTPEIGLASGTRGLERSISNAVERNLSASEMDLFEVRQKEDRKSALNSINLLAPFLEMVPLWANYGVWWGRRFKRNRFVIKKISLKPIAIMRWYL